MYDIHMHLYSFNTITNDGSKYVATIFNINTQKIHIVCVYIAHSCSISTFVHKTSNCNLTLFQTFSNHHNERF
jgi:hypothetical protein